MNCLYNVYNKVVYDNPSENWHCIIIEWIVEDYSFVNKEEVLGYVKFSPLYVHGKKQEFKIVSPSDGYFYIIQESGSFDIRNGYISDWDNELLSIVFDNNSIRRIPA